MALPSGEWIKAIHEALGLILEELGNRVGLDRSWIYLIE